MFRYEGCEPMKSEAVRVCFSLDSGYLHTTRVAIYSLIESSQSNLEINIIGVDLKEDEWVAMEEIRHIRSDIVIDFVRHDLSRLDYQDKVSKSLPMLSVLLLPKLVTGRILYLDGDILVVSDLAELFFRDMQGMPISACKASKNLVFRV